MFNPASGRGPDGELYLLPRLCRGNVSRVALAKVAVSDGVQGRWSGWAWSRARTDLESGPGYAGVEDPRVT